MMTTPSFQDIVNHPIPTIDIVDIGAMAEGQERYHALLSSGLARVTGFEPNPDEFALLCDRPGPYRYLPAFLGHGGPAAFHLTRHPGCSSLLEPDPEVIDMFLTLGCAAPTGNFHVEKTVTVDTTRLDDFGGDLLADFIKLDVQGFELEILRNGTNVLKQTLIVETEVEFVPLYKDQPLLGDMQCFMREQGFLFHKLIDVSGRAFKPFMSNYRFLPISQLLWADAIFVRDFTRLDAYTDDALLKAAAVLDVAYGSYDLAALLLKEFDGRRSTGLCGRYVAALQKRRIDECTCLNFKTET